MQSSLDSTFVLKSTETVAPDFASDLPLTSHITIISNLQGLMALREQWQALEQDSWTATSVFQSFDWIASWCETYCAGDEAADIHTLVGYDNNRLVFVFPLMLKKPKGVRMLTWLSDPFGQYGDVICAKDQNPHLWIANALTFLRRLKGIDLLRLRHVRADSTLAVAAAHHLMDARLNECAPFLDLTAYKTEDDYENRYTGTQRKRRKKIRRHLEEKGPVTFTQLRLGTDSDRAVDEAIAEKNLWLADRGRINRVMSCPRHASFLKRLSRRTSNAMNMIVTELAAGGKPVSWEIAFQFGGTHFAYITSHVNALTDLSPGRLHFDLSQRACLAGGLERYDLMVPHDAHKESWSSGKTDTKDYFLPLNLRGRLVGEIYLRRVRPILRSVYYSLPSWALRAVNR
jgi:CelD/BcsL family acetyltransferase involved in cellulose biosynthesis